MRIAVVSDIHGNLPALQAVCDEISAEGVDLTVNLGDLASGPLWPAETCDRLIALGWPAIRGNHERQVLGDRSRMGWTDALTLPRLRAGHLQWLSALPASLRLAEGAVRCVHGSPDDDLTYLLETVMPDLGAHGSPGVRASRDDEIRRRLGTLEPTVEVMLCGHSHVPRVVQCGAILLVNPGSVGLPAFDDGHPHPHVVESGSPHARWALLERGDKRWHVQLRATDYDAESAARQALSQKRPDWADALRTGRVGRTEAQAMQMART